MNYSAWRRSYNRQRVKLLRKNENDIASLLRSLRKAIYIPDEVDAKFERQVEGVLETYTGAYEQTLLANIERAASFEAEGVKLQGVPFVEAAITAGLAAHLLAHVPDAQVLAEQALGRNLPSGMTLSGRIWDLRYERDITAIIRNGIASNFNAETISRQLDGFVLPGRQVTTPTPYGRSLNFDSMRLARTEVMRAYRETAKEALGRSPWVTALIWRRTGQDECAECDVLEGNRYGPSDVIPMDPHPQCACILEQEAMSDTQWSRALDDYMTTGRDELGIAGWLAA